VKLEQLDLTDILDSLEVVERKDKPDALESQVCKYKFISIF